MSSHVIHIHVNIESAYERNYGIFLLDSGAILFGVLISSFICVPGNDIILFILYVLVHICASVYVIHLTHICDTFVYMYGGKGWE